MMLRLLAMAVAIVGTGILSGMATAASTASPSEGRPGLQALVDATVDGDVLDIPSGTWHGPIVVRTPMTLRGTDVIVDGGGTGTVVTIAAPGVVVEGLDVRGSGEQATGQSDACIRINREASGAIVRDNTLVACYFGIWVSETDGARVEGNVVTGDQRRHRSQRGNGIHLYNASNLVVTDNTVTGGRDGIYVSTTRDSLIARNHLERTRYGIHYMYANDNVIRGNVTLHNGAGIALMQSRRLEVDENVSRHNERNGILLRDVLYSQVRNNRLEQNTEGLFFYGGQGNTVAGNRIAGNDIGLKIWGHSIRNTVTRNDFIGNRRQVFYVGTHDLEWGVDEVGNRWSDYVGWDQDGDGIGDRPYRVESFTSRLLYQFPAAALLLRSPSLELLAHMEQRLPMLRSPTIIDRRPLMYSRVDEGEGS